MFEKDMSNEEIKRYTEFMELLKEQNSEYIECLNSSSYKIGHFINSMKKVFFNPVLFWRKVKGFFSRKKVERKFPTFSSSCSTYNNSNFFNKNKIAVYSAIAGDYDKIYEPLFVPDNCDFYMVTDNELGKDSIWKKISMDDCLPPENNFNPSKKNRYCKMFPHKLPIISEYKYSIYIDGNIKVISDLTEYVNRLTKYGLAMHLHSSRLCVYDELSVCMLLGKETKNNLELQRKHLIACSFPEKYGMLECNVIVRENHNKIMQLLMSEWWDEYLNYAKRDQLSLPLVLFRHGIKIKEIGLLGENVFKNYSFRIHNHNG